MVIRHARASPGPVAACDAAIPCSVDVDCAAGNVIRDNHQLTSISLPRLASAGSVQISGQTTLAALDLGALRAVDGALSIVQNGGNALAAVMDLRVSALERVGGDLVVVDNPHLPSNLVAQLVDQVLQGLGIGGVVTTLGNGPDVTPASSSD